MTPCGKRHKKTGTTCIIVSGHEYGPHWNATAGWWGHPKPKETQK